MGAGRLIQMPAQGFEPGSPAWKAGILPPRQLAPRAALIAEAGVFLVMNASRLGQGASYQITAKLVKKTLQKA